MKRHFSTHLMTVLILVAFCLAPAAAFAAGSGPAYDVRFTGVIEALPEESVVGTWTIAEQSVGVDEETLIRPQTGGRPAAPGLWAAVIAQRDEDGNLVASQIAVQEPEIRLKGPVNFMPEEGDTAEEKIGTWVVAGQNIEVVEDTAFNERYGALAVDRWAEVFALEEKGVLVAQRIRSVEFQEEVEIYGVIQDFAVPWTLSTIDLIVTDETIVTAEPRLGLLAHAAATLAYDETEGYSLTARNIRVMWQEPGGLHQAAQFRATVETLPEGNDGLIGTWSVTRDIDGEVVEETVEVTGTTSIVQQKGLIIEGSVVHIVGWEADGAIQAVQITLVDADGVWKGKAFYHAGTIQDMPPGNGLMGHWTIGDQRLRVTERTRIEGAQYARVGAPAEAGGVQLRSGERVLTWLRIRDIDGPGPGPAQPTIDIE